MGRGDEQSLRVRRKTLGVGPTSGVDYKLRLGYVGSLNADSERAGTLDLRPVCVKRCWPVSVIVRPASGSPHPSAWDRFVRVEERLTQTSTEG